MPIKFQKITRKAIEDAVAKLEEVHKAENLDELEAAMEAVNTAWAGASQEIYAASQAEAEAAAGAAGAEGDAAGGGESSPSDDDDAVDATLKLSTKTTKISKLILNILGIESSCDDTAASVLPRRECCPMSLLLNPFTIQLVGSFLNSLQELITKPLAKPSSRALTEAQLSIQEIDVIAVTQGPGLMARY